MDEVNGRSGGIRTHDPFTPSQFVRIARTDLANL